jgi:hypothetical protein
VGQAHQGAGARPRPDRGPPVDVWPHRGAKPSAGQHAISRAEKEAIRRQGLLNEDGDLEPKSVCDVPHMSSEAYLTVAEPLRAF